VTDDNNGVLLILKRAIRPRNFSTCKRRTFFIMLCRDDFSRRKF
jgi:hypothetical protein